jgi:hypothetical protein
VKGVIVKRFRIAGVIAAAVATAALATGGALAAKPPVHKPVKFTGSYSGKAVVRVAGSKADINADATGTSVPLGKSKLSGKGVGSATDPCPLFGGTATITTAKGMKLNFLVAPAAGNACTDEEGQQFSISGRATIKGGTAKYLKAKGTFKFTGSFDRGTGLFSVKFTGLLTV